MPIEIRELIVRTRIGTPEDREKPRRSPVKTGETPETVREVLDQLDEIIKRQNER